MSREVAASGAQPQAIPEPFGTDLILSFSRCVVVSVRDSVKKTQVTLAIPQFLNHGFITELELVTFGEA